MREFTKDEVLEYLIRARIDSSLEAMKAIVSREPMAEDFVAMDRKIGMMHDGWVRMNGNIRKLSR